MIVAKENKLGDLIYRTESAKWQRRDGKEASEKEYGHRGVCCHSGGG